MSEGENNVNETTPVQETAAPVATEATAAATSTVHNLESLGAELPAEPAPVKFADPEPGKEYLGTGRRKSAVARVRLSAGSGKITINGRDPVDYFKVENMREFVFMPFKATDTSEKFDVKINVSGGGISGQAGAVRHGISRALLELDANYRPSLKTEGYLTRDPRKKERKKYGQPKARKRFQYSKR
jgi:small subunit ribosomal protein S9